MFIFRGDIARCLLCVRFSRVSFAFALDLIFREVFFTRLLALVVLVGFVIMNLFLIRSRLFLPGIVEPLRSFCLLVDWWVLACVSLRVWFFSSFRCYIGV
eukprot:UN4542